MYKILKKKTLAIDTYLMDVEAPRLAKAAQPGQFLIVKMSEKGERIPLTITDYDRGKGIVTIVFKAIGKSTLEMANLNVGDAFSDVGRPLGKPADLLSLPSRRLKNKKYVFVARLVWVLHLSILR